MQEKQKIDSKNTKLTNDSRAEGVEARAANGRQYLGDKIGALQSEARELPQAVMTEAELKQSPILAQETTQQKKPTPSKVLCVVSGGVDDYVAADLL